MDKADHQNEKKYFLNFVSAAFQRKLHLHLNFFQLFFHSLGILSNSHFLTVREHQTGAWGWQFLCKSSLKVLTGLKTGYIRDFCASALLENEGGSPGGRRDDRHHGPHHVGQEHRHFIFNWRLGMILLTQ